MKKRFFIPACVLNVIAIGFIGHTQLSLACNKELTDILYGLYVVLVIGAVCSVILEKGSAINIMAFLLELAAILFLVQSILAVSRQTGVFLWHWDLTSLPYW